jgi:hypothetical protein
MLLSFACSRSWELVYCGGSQDVSCVFTSNVAGEVPGLVGWSSKQLKSESEVNEVDCLRFVCSCQKAPS